MYLKCDIPNVAFSECTIQWNFVWNLYQWVSEWVSELVSQSVSEWVSEWVTTNDNLKNEYFVPFAKLYLVEGKTSQKETSIPRLALSLWDRGNKNILPSMGCDDVTLVWHSTLVFLFHRLTFLLPSRYIQLLLNYIVSLALDLLNLSGSITNHDVQLVSNQLASY